MPGLVLCAATRGECFGVAGTKGKDVRADGVIQQFSDHLEKIGSIPLRPLVGKIGFDARSKKGFEKYI